MSERTWIDDLVDEAVDAIRAELKPHGPGPLGMTGLDPVLVDLGLKIVVGVVIGLLNKSILDRWSASKTRKELEQLRSEVLAVKVQVARLDAQSLQKTIESELVQQGVPEDHAPAIATAVIGNVAKALPPRLTTAS